MTRNPEGFNIRHYGTDDRPAWPPADEIYETIAGATLTYDDATGGWIASRGGVGAWGRYRRGALERLADLERACNDDSAEARENAAAARLEARWDHETLTIAEVESWHS